MTQPNNAGAGGLIRIYRRGKKETYTADFWHDGRHLRRSLRTRNLKVARARARELLSHLDELTGAPRAEMAMDCAITIFIDHLRTEGRRPKTVKKYSGLLKTFAQFCTGRRVLPLRHVTSLLIDEFRAIRKPTHSDKSMHNEGVMLKTFFRWARQRSLIKISPMTEMVFRKPPPVPRGGPTREQIDQILAAAPGGCFAQLSLLAFTGMRSGELQHLQPSDVDLAENWIHVVSREGAETKTGFGRKIPIHPRLRPVLEKLPKRKRAWLFTAGASKKFPDGEHWISTKRLNEDFLALVKTLGLPAGRFEGFTIHSLRHSFETIAVNAGVPQRAVDTWLGHRSDKSMAAVYYSLSDVESQRFMSQVPFGTGAPAAHAGDTEVRR